ncbi:hypothetical protein TorRG33x02_284800, partial [Trema orientale]
NDGSDGHETLVGDVLGDDGPETSRNYVNQSWPWGISWLCFVRLERGGNGRKRGGGRERKLILLKN